jgi:hypothetical protein
MMSTTRCKRQVWIAALLVATALCADRPAMAGVVPFTWDPAGAAPPLAGPGSAFTADTIFLTGFLRDVGQPDGTGAAHYFSVVTGFGLHGNPVSPAGFGSQYGLYFDIADTHTSGPPPEILHFSSINVSLRADPGNQNGPALATVGGVGFANTGPTGQADDITLATGSMVTSFSNLDVATGVLTTGEVETFQPSPGQTGFFSSPVLDGSILLDIVSSNPATFVSTPQPDGTTITTFNGFVGTGHFAVPEPPSIVALAAGLLGLASVLRRSQR